MEVQKDFKELLELFNSNKVEYVIVGSYALAFHGAPRYTGDIDPNEGFDFLNMQAFFVKKGRSASGGPPFQK
ncbi:MAG: hypothetical protein PHX78_05340 [bacterium]|nr:hypothetical protein [bacterium]